MPAPAPILLPDAGPLITLAHADRLDLLLRPGWPLRLVDMVLHELTRNATPTRDAITAFVARKLDVSYYDLLASEARLASFVSVAKGDVPQSHWFHLSRALISLKGRVTLVSWT